MEKNFSIPRIATYDTKDCIFQYKLLNNVLYLNQKLHHFVIASCSKCSFCDIHDQIPLHLIYECVCVQNIWKQLILCLAWEKNDLPFLTPQSVIFGLVKFKIKTISCLIIYSNIQVQYIQLKRQ